MNIKLLNGVNIFNIEGQIVKILKKDKTMELIVDDSSKLIETNTPIYNHDCPKCLLVAGNKTIEDKDLTIKKYDLYFCGNAYEDFTLLARYGNNPEDYSSGKAFIGLNIPITICFEEAVNSGLMSFLKLDVGPILKSKDYLNYIKTWKKNL